MDLWVREARLFKYGSGTGSNFSKLRSENEKLSGGGKSSGLMSFLRIGDRAAGAIKSGGTTRRAAKMVVVDVDHPDIEAYIDWKVKEEQKVAALVTGSKICQRRLKAIMKACVNCEAEGEACFDPAKNPALKRAIKEARRDLVPDNYIRRIIQFARQGYKDIDFATYDTDWDSEAYLTVSGQNSNNSVRVTDEFLDAVEEDKDWALTARLSGKTVKTLKARDLWEKIGHAAWASADPGIQFHTTINDWHTCPKSGPIRASNPCSEYMFLDDTACNLASLNLMRFPAADAARAADARSGPSGPKAEKRFDVAAFEHACRLWTIALEISVLMAQFPSRKIAELSYRYRTLGLGLRQHRRPADGVGHPLRQPRGPRHLRRAFGHHDRRRLCHVRRDGQGARALPRLRAQPVRHAARHPQSPPRRLRPQGRLREARHPAGAARCRRLSRTTAWWRPPSAPGTRPSRSARSTASATPSRP